MPIKTQRDNGMNLAELQSEMRHFAAERNWQPFHTPKNLTTALMVEAAELAEIFQWMTPEESTEAHRDPMWKQRIGEEVADVLLYLLQVADHSQIDMAYAVKDKLARNAVKHPAKQTIARVSPASAAVLGTHVLLDYENVQPTEAELRAMVPDATQVWVFHGPHQKQVEERFASFGANVTAVPISKTGKNALDFHLSFYMGYIASRNQASRLVVVANDKGYGPMLEHAKAMGFVVHQMAHGRAKSVANVKPALPQKASAAPTPVARKAATKPTPAKKAAVKQPVAKKVPANKATAKKTSAPAPKKAPAKKVTPAKQGVAKSANAVSVKKTGLGSATGGHAPAPASSPRVGPTSVSADLFRKVTDNLRKMGSKRPVKAASLRRALKSFLGAETGDESIENALSNLVSTGVVAVSAARGVSYPGFALET